MFRWPFTCISSPDSHINDPWKALMSLGSSQSLWKTFQNRTSIELPVSIKTQLMSQLLCFTMMTSELLFWGRIPATSLLENVILILDYPYSFLGYHGDMKSWLIPIRRISSGEELELLQPENLLLWCWCWNVELRKPSSNDDERGMAQVSFTRAPRWAPLLWWNRYCLSLLSAQETYFSMFFIIGRMGDSLGWCNFHKGKHMVLAVNEDYNPPAFARPFTNIILQNSNTIKVIIKS